MNIWILVTAGAFIFNWDVPVPAPRAWTVGHYYSKKECVKERARYGNQKNMACLPFFIKGLKR